MHGWMWDSPRGIQSQVAHRPALAPLAPAPCGIVRPPPDVGATLLPAVPAARRGPLFR